MLDRAACRSVSAAVALILTCAAGIAAGHDRDHEHDWDRDRGPITLEVISTFDAGGLGSAEIVAYDSQSRRLFVVNALTSTVDILDVRNPKRPDEDSHHRHVRARLAEQRCRARRPRRRRHPERSEDRSRPRRVLQGQRRAASVSVHAGALPDMLTFTPDGDYVLVANEGEPSGYGVGHVDPEGSVSIIRIPNSQSQLEEARRTRTCAHVSFAQFNGQEASLRAQGIRIYGPGATRRAGLRAGVHRGLRRTRARRT